MTKPKKPKKKPVEAWVLKKTDGTYIRQTWFTKEKPYEYLDLDVDWVRVKLVEVKR